MKLAPLAPCIVRAGEIADPLKREWERGVDMGEDSTDKETVRRPRPLPAGRCATKPEKETP